MSNEAPAMQVSRTQLKDALTVRPVAHDDPRGLFKETYVASRYRQAGIPDVFVQDSISVSRRHVLRGLHCDPQMSKLVQVLRGEAFDVIVDARRHSESFGKWQCFELSESNGLQVYVPAGFLHGFLALSDDVIFSYKQSAEYAPGREIGVIWNDPDLGVEWPLSAPPLVSPKDQRNARFTEAFV